MYTPANTFKQSLARGEPQFGLWLALADPLAAELCAGCGFDWVVIDGEHSPNDLRSTLAGLQAVAAAAAVDPGGRATHPVVRVPHGDPALIKQVLDIGATTVIVPMVESAAQARELVRAMRYPPDGIRGVGSAIARSSRWMRFPEHVHEAAEQTCLLVQIESRAGLAQIEAIAAVDGVDGLFIGPADLAASLGHLGDATHEDVRAAIESAIVAIVGAGKAAGILTGDDAMARRCIEIGARFVAVGVDTLLLAGAARALAARFRSAPPRPAP